MTDYNIPASDKMRLKHDAKARITVKSNRTTLEDGLTPVESLDGALTRIGFMYNRLSYSGGVSWWNPATGYPIARPTVQIRLRRQDILTGDKECDCSKCIS